LIAGMAVAGCVSLCLLVFAVISIVKMNEAIEETKKHVSKVEKLKKQKPAPGIENENRIKADIEVYNKAKNDLRATFQSPLQKAAEAFIKVLMPPRKDKLTQEEIEALRQMPANGADDLSEEQIAGLPIRKMNQDEFKNFFAERFKKYFSVEEIGGKSAGDLRIFINEFSRIFPNWGAAVKAFGTEASKLTAEELSANTTLPLLFYSLGFKRFLPSDPYDNIEKFSENIAKTAGSMDVGVALNEFMLPWSSFDENRKREGRLQFSRLTRDDLRAVMFHWDVLGDIVPRLSKSGIKRLHGVTVRNFSEPREDRTIGFDRTFEEIGDYKYYHYTIHVSGTVDAVREAARRFDNGYKNNRFYIVRAVTFYAGENGAAVLMKQDVQPEKERSGSSSMSVVSGRGGRKLFRTEDPAMIDDSLGVNRNEKELEEERKRIAEAEAKLPPDQRSGYGTILIGNVVPAKTPAAAGNSGDAGDADTVKYSDAFIDIDYVVLKQE